MTSRARVELQMPEPLEYPGTFIAFEGGERAGKSTQAKFLAGHLRAAGREVLLTREPGGTPAAEVIRDVVLNPMYDGLDARAEALLFAASRGEHVARLVRPALDRGDVVITDRYLDSSIAYQGVARGLGRDVIEGLSLWATHGLVPDLTVVLDVDPARGVGRVCNPDRLEAEPIDFHDTVRKAFLGLAARSPHRYLVLDAQRDRHDLAREIAERVDHKS